MMYLTTGTPGAGKTLFTLKTIEDRRIADNKAFYDEWVKKGSDENNPPMVRQVYYHNIKINRSKLNWIPLDKVEDWFNMPIGSIFFFDECQEAFPPMASSAIRPEYYTKLSKHRHSGFDIYLVTQHPSFLDTYVRKNVEEHNHYMRPFGAQFAVKHTWKGVKDQCDKSRSNSMDEKHFYPKEVYSWYKSSEVHTHKFKLPLKVKMFALIPIFLGLCIWYVWTYFDKKIHPENIKPVAVQVDSNGKPIASAGNGIVRATFEPSDFKPRIADLPWTAPRYDALTQPTVAPRIVGCMIMQNMCKCLTQQGTYHIATMQFCIATVEHGIFQDFEDNVGGGKQAEGKMVNPERRIEQHQQQSNSESAKTGQQATQTVEGNTNPQDFRPKPWTSRFSDTASLSTLK